MTKNKEENNMENTVPRTMKINAFSEMKRILSQEMKIQGLSAEDIRKELPKRFHEK